MYFIGFPFGFGTDELIQPIVRSGSIAWLPKNRAEYLIDAFSYGGNSGSPIFRKILFGAIPGKIDWELPKLVGMITGHQNLSLENVLTQPDPSELKFVKGNLDINLGLARCVFMDDIMELAAKLSEF